MTCHSASFSRPCNLFVSFALAIFTVPGLRENRYTTLSAMANQSRCLSHSASWCSKPSTQTKGVFSGLRFTLFALFSPAWVPGSFALVADTINDGQQHRARSSFRRPLCTFPPGRRRGRRGRWGGHAGNSLRVDPKPFQHLTSSEGQY